MGTKESGKDLVTGLFFLHFLQVCNSKDIFKMNQKRINEVFLQIIHCLLNIPKFAKQVLKTRDLKFRQKKKPNKP